MSHSLSLGLNTTDMRLYNPFIFRFRSVWVYPRTIYSMAYHSIIIKINLTEWNKYIQRISSIF